MVRSVLAGDGEGLIELGDELAILAHYWSSGTSSITTSSQVASASALAQRLDQHVELGVDFTLALKHLALLLEGLLERGAELLGHLIDVVHGAAPHALISSYSPASSHVHLP
jgi:hypothetical protein